MGELKYNSTIKTMATLKGKHEKRYSTNKTTDNRKISKGKKTKLKKARALSTAINGRLEYRENY